MVDERRRLLLLVLLAGGGRADGNMKCSSHDNAFVTEWRKCIKKSNAV